MKTALCILLLLPQFVFAQRDSLKAISGPLLNLSSGVGFSPAYVASKNSQWVNYLKPGYHGTVSTDVPLFHSFWGIKASFEYMDNAFDLNKYVAYQNSQASYRTITPISYGAFNQWFLMLGAYASVSCHKMCFKLWAQGGLQYLALPNYEENVVFQTNESPYNYTVINNHALAAAFGAGINASYQLSKRIAATAGIALLYTNFQNTGTDYQDSYTPAIKFHLSNGFAEKGSMAVCNADLGISYYLGKK